MFFYAAIILLVTSVVGLLGESSWFFDLFSHFRPYYLLFAVILLFLALVLRVKSYAIFAALAVSITINLLFIVPFYRTKKSQDVYNSGSALSVVSINVNRLNSETEQLREYIQNNSPDILILSELTPDLAQQISWLGDYFLYGKAVLQNDNFGLGIFSKYHILNTNVLREKELSTPLITTEIEMNGRVLTVIAAHPFPPIDSVGKQSRDNYFDMISKEVNSTKNPVLLCGDLNVTPWSVSFRKLLKQSKLNAPSGLGTFATWPTNAIHLGIAIDHCLTSEEILSLSYERGTYVGSDHLPIKMTFSFDTDRQPTNK